MSIQNRLKFLLALALTASMTSAARADNKAVLGTWDITIEGDFEEAGLDITLEIEEDKNGKLTATWTTPRGDDELEDVKWDGKTLTFVRILEFLGEEYDVEHTAKVTGDTLEGEMELPRREVEFSGERADEED